MDIKIDSIENPLLTTHDPQTVTQLESLLITNLRNCDLPDEHINYLAHMILEDPPRNIEDLLTMIKDFMDNDPLMTYDRMRETSAKILNELSGIVENKQSAWVAKRLDQPLVMQKVQLISAEEELAGYTDTPFSFEMLRFNNEFIDPEKWEENQKLAKQKEKERKVKQLLLSRRMEEINQLEFRLPPIRIDRNKDGNYSLDIKVDNFSLDVSGKQLLENAKLILSGGHKYGLIGKNGIGKTTLLYALARKEIDGMNTKPQILMIEQEIIGTEKSPLQIVLETDGEREQLLKREEELKVNDGTEEELTKVYQALADIEAEKAEPKARTLLDGLGFSKEMIEAPTKLLSGGWRMRVALAKVLFCEPDILLLDEPTNHLDLDAVMWLQDYLQNFPSTVIIVSHAREFLNMVCTDIMNFNNLTLEYYKGNYDDFERQRDSDLFRQEKEYEAQQKQISHVQSFIDRFRYNAKKASLVQSRLKYLEKIERVEKVISDDPNYMFKFNEPEKVRPPIIRVDNGYFSYQPDGDYLLKDLNFAVDMDSKVALLGANGVGKTTFLKLLVEELRLREGSYYHNKKARISMFSQHHVEKLNLALSPLEQFTQTYPDASMESIRKHLGCFGITGNISMRPIYVLSGGQKSRVSLALAAWENPHILIMDEPTNHLDMEAVDALILALNAFNGGLVVVSHDQYFVSCVCDEIWYIKNKNLKKFNGDFEGYRNSLATNRL